MNWVIYIAALVVVPVSCLLLWIASIVHKFRRIRSTLTKFFPVCDKSHWLFGHLGIFPGLNEEGLAMMAKWVRKCPRYYVFNFGPLRSSVVLNHPDPIKAITNTAEPKQVGYGYGYLIPWLGDGLLISDGAKWFRNRKMLTHGFHFDVLKPYVDVYNECVEIMMDILEKESALPQCSVDIFPAVTRCTLDIILRCAFSATKNIQQNKEDDYANAVFALGKRVMQRYLQPHLHVNAIYAATAQGKQFYADCRFSHKFASEIIDKRRKELAVSQGDSDTRIKGRHVDFLDILLLAKDSDGNGLSQQDILDEVETFMFEGHDTTTSGISWILYNLARHPDMQARAKQEVDLLLEGRSSDRLTWSDMSEMPYLTRCIKESMRVDPPVPLVTRTLSKPLVIDGMELPAGTNLDIQIWNLHHNAEVWSDPDTYDPDRFLPENMKKMDSHAFLPFSAGPRNCIGQIFAMNEMKTTVARIIHRYDVTVDTTKEVGRAPGLVLRAESGIHLFFKKRD